MNSQEREDLYRLLVAKYYKKYEENRIKRGYMKTASTLISAKGQAWKTMKKMGL